MMKLFNFFYKQKHCLIFSKFEYIYIYVKYTLLHPNLKNLIISCPKIFPVKQQQQQKTTNRGFIYLFIHFSQTGRKETCYALNLMYHAHLKNKPIDGFFSKKFNSFQNQLISSIVLNIVLLSSRTSLKYEISLGTWCFNSGKFLIIIY